MSTVLFTVKDHVATVTLNRPETHNAFEPVMIQQLTDIFRAQISDEVRLVILRGEGRSFCTGADLTWMQSMAKYTLQENQVDSEKLFAMFAALRACPVPLIGRLHGHVMGGALGLAAACDIAAAERSTAFSFSEVRLGLVPAVISSFVLEKMSRTSVHRLMLTGETFSADEARSSGLIHFSGDELQLNQFIDQTQRAILSAGPTAVRLTKSLLRFQYQNDDWEALRSRTTHAIAEQRVSQEGQEGMRAFFEKRDPSWKSGK
jgi:methylglutaconyl-CoA hydratase